MACREMRYPSLTTGMGILRVLGRETAEREQYEESCRKHASSLLKLAQWRNCMDPLYGAFSGLPFSVGLTAGTLAALMDLVMRIFWPVNTDHKLSYFGYH